MDQNTCFVVDMAKGPQWVVVRSARFPERRAKSGAIARSVVHISRRGHLASVGFASVDDPEGPLWRGHAAAIDFEGLKPLDLQTEPASNPNDR